LRQYKQVRHAQTLEGEQEDVAAKGRLHPVTSLEVHNETVASKKLSNSYKQKLRLNQHRQ